VPRYYGINRRIGEASASGGRGTRDERRGDLAECANGAIRRRYPAAVFLLQEISSLA